MSNRIEVANNLRVILGRHSGRADSTLRMSITVAESLRRIFDDYLRKELDDLRSQLNSLQEVGRDMDKEVQRLDALEIRFEETNSKLNAILDAAKDGKIKALSWQGTSSEEGQLFRLPPRPKTQKKQQTSVEELDINTLVDGFILLGELEDLRKDIERWSRTYVRDMDDILSVIDERLRQARS